jgi:hypothetical protein
LSTSFQFTMPAKKEAEAEAARAGAATAEKRQQSHQN